jgi:L-ascorbate metabolism protein UlaG (beta-lactamase superfamily)
MWCKQNEDTSWTICEAFWTVIDGKVTLVDKYFDKSKITRGFSWEADADVINGYLAHNADLIAAELEGLEKWR